MFNSGQPLFSIITVCYNSGRTIERTIKSVLQQSFQDYEYIIVDGGSTDTTIDVVKKYESHFQGRMHWQSEPDNGIYDAFNKGIRLSTGKLLWIVNSDDFMEPDALENIWSFYKEREENVWPVTSFAMNVLLSNGEISHRSFYSKRTSMHYYRRDEMGIVHPATIVPRKIYDMVGLYDTDFKIAGDFFWFHCAVKKGIEIQFQNCVITNFSCGGVSTTDSHYVHIMERKLFFSKKYPNKWERVWHYARWRFLYFRIVHGWTFSNIVSKMK